MGAWAVTIDDGVTESDPLPSAVPQSYTLNGGFRPGEFTFVAKVTDPELIASMPWGDEMVTVRVNLYEDGELRWRGRPLPFLATFAGQNVTFRCKTDEWAFEHRFYGWAERLNQLENGSFEDWTAGEPDDWTLVGSATVDEVAAIAEGTSAARLTHTAGNSYLMQQETAGFDIGYYPGLTAIATAWGKIQSGSVTRGDQLAWLAADGAPGLFEVPWQAPQDMAAGEMFRVGIRLFVSAGQDWTAELRLYSINGEIDWDDAEIVFPDSTTVAQNGGVGEDVANLVTNSFQYAQTSPWSDLGIAVDAPDTGLMAIPGVNLAGFDHSKHETIASGIQRIMNEYGVEVWIGTDDTAHLRIKRGTRRDIFVDTDLAIPSALGTPLGASAVIEVEGDPTLGHNVAIVYGESELFAADEAGAIDLSAFGGLTLAKLAKARDGSAPLSLQAQADAIVAREAFAPVFPKLRMPTAMLVLEVGDIIPIAASYGWVQIPETDYRITSITVEPGTAGGMQICTLDLDDGRPLDSDP